METSSIQPARPPLSQQPPRRVGDMNNNDDERSSDQAALRQPTMVITTEAIQSNQINNNEPKREPQNNDERNVNDNNNDNKERGREPKLNNHPSISSNASNNAINNNNNPSSVSTKQGSNIPNVNISSAYKRRSLKHQIYCGVRVKIGINEINELMILLGDKKCSMYKNNNSFNRCVVCDEQCVEGEFAVENILFIPNKNDPSYENLGRFRVELPRVSCHECASEYAQVHNIVPINYDAMKTLAYIWKEYTKGNITNNGQSKKTQNDSNTKILQQHNMTNKNNNNNNNNDDEKQQIVGSSNKDTRNIGTSNNNTSKATVPLSEADRDPFDDGFLICTQLVKTGGADQGGLQVGDVFVEFGHYSKKRFPGLKSIANLVRRSAGKEICVVVWRKLEQMNTVDDDGTGRTVFQKLALKLKPLQSHDADGGGVLGAVINTYPLPEMKN